jgi:hypothetical protein
MGVGEQTVENGIRKRRLAKCFVPLLDGQLAGHDGGVTLVPVLDDFEQIGGLLVGERLQRQVVDAQNARRQYERDA